MYLTACYITKNESRNLSASLATVAPIADRIVVVDTGSTDDTVEIARRCGAGVLSFPWQDDFAAARNFALDHAAPSETPEDSDRWILFLDADESLPHAEGLREMLAGLSAASPAPEGVLLTLVNVDDDAEGLEISRFHALRLWRQRPHYRYRGAIHEVLDGLPSPAPLTSASSCAIRDTVRRACARNCCATSRCSRQICRRMASSR